MNRKKIVLVKCKILGLFFNGLTTNDKYCFLDRDNLTQPIQTQLSKKGRPLSESFSVLFKSRSNFEHFEK